MRCPAGIEWKHNGCPGVRDFFSRCATGRTPKAANNKVTAVRSDEVGGRFQTFRINDLELVTQIFPRWNQVADWLREAERFSMAA